MKLKTEITTAHSTLLNIHGQKKTNFHMFCIENQVSTDAQQLGQDPSGERIREVPLN